jgi:hypothetical protein
MLLLMLEFFLNYCKTNNKVVTKQPKNKPFSKKQKMKNEKMERFTFFALCFLS